MNRLVVDASVAIKWYLPEVHSEDALRLLNDERELLVPDLVWSEVGNILWKKWLKDQLTAEQPPAILQDLGHLGLVIHSAQELAPTAWELASRLKRSFTTASTSRWRKVNHVPWSQRIAGCSML